MGLGLRVGGVGGGLGLHAGVLRAVLGFYVGVTEVDFYGTFNAREDALNRRENVMLLIHEFYCVAMGSRLLIWLGHPIVFDLKTEFHSSFRYFDVGVECFTHVFRLDCFGECLQ